MQDIKIRLAGEGAEDMLKRQIDHILSFNWENQPIGKHNFSAHSLLQGADRTPIGQIAFYRTKTQRVVYLSMK